MPAVVDVGKLIDRQPIPGRQSWRPLPGDDSTTDCIPIRCKWRPAPVSSVIAGMLPAHLRIGGGEPPGRSIRTIGPAQHAVVPRREDATECSGPNFERSGRPARVRPEHGGMSRLSRNLVAPLRSRSWARPNRAGPCSWGPLNLSAAEPTLPCKERAARHPGTGWRAFFMARPAERACSRTC